MDIALSISTDIEHFRHCQYCCRTQVSVFSCVVGFIFFVLSSNCCFPPFFSFTLSSRQHTQFRVQISVLVILGCHNKCHRLDGFNHRNYFSQYWRVEFKIQMPAEPVFGKASLFRLQMATSLWCLHMAFPWCMGVEREGSKLSGVSLYRCSNPILKSHLS